MRFELRPARRTNRGILTTCLGVLTLAFALGFAAPAHACPPGHYGIGGGTGGWVGCAPMDGGVGQAESPASVERFN
nr:hypothetical protein [Hyphomonadaceae bacterium]